MDIQYLNRESHHRLAYIYSPSSDVGRDLPAVMFCGGFRSDMMGTKAAYFEAQCQARGQEYLRFDYSGHGASGGDFKDGMIGSWFADALDVFDAIINKPVIIVGSSMGGWIGLLMAQARADFVKGLVGIAAAPDFTERLYHEELSEDHRRTIAAQGYVEIPNEYSDDPYVFTADLFEDGRRNMVLNQAHTHTYPIALFHGMRDTSVPESVPLLIKETYSGGPLDITFIDDGDHRLSRPQDLVMIDAAIDGLSRNID